MSLNKLTGAGNVAFGYVRRNLRLIGSGNDLVQRWERIALSGSQRAITSNAIQNAELYRHNDSKVATINGNRPKCLQDNLRYSAIGRCVVDRILSEIVMTEFPEIPTSEIIDIVSSIVYLQRRNNEKEATDLIAEIGTYYTRGRDLDDLHALVTERFVFDRSRLGIKHLVKLNHPKSVLLEIIGKRGQDVHLKTSIMKGRNYQVTVGLFVNDNIVGEAVGENFITAERDVCRDYLLSECQQQLNDTDLPSGNNVVMEEEIHLRDSPKQRHVDLVKEEGERYGFYVRGGVQEEITNVKYRNFYYFSPIYISKIEPGSPAARSGKLQVGDVILGIEGASVKGLPHNKIVKLISERTTNLSLTVVLNPDVKIRDYLMMKDQERQVKKLSVDVSTAKWREWHLAQAEKDPTKYLKLLKELENAKSEL